MNLGQPDSKTLEQLSQKKNKNKKRTRYILPNQVPLLCYHQGLGPRLVLPSNSARSYQLGVSTVTAKYFSR